MQFSKNNKAIFIFKNLGSRRLKRDFLSLKTVKCVEYFLKAIVRGPSSSGRQNGGSNEIFDVARALVKFLRTLLTLEYRGHINRTRLLI
ncbi:hypothetical protein TSAR_005734 [Trichomalopsis sarcophagae]|uniref:Uncharacterized protein n=1 Tax=Trichomalopsis sarcophagae TaxID=543379 RepID=A0A232EKW9_9HYME|nr:hypothetical protein TSAR_005734 [Trichomalopsis sarcophagae]